MGRELSIWKFQIIQLNQAKETPSRSNSTIILINLYKVKVVIITIYLNIWLCTSGKMAAP
jgi:hypothetical protein